MTKIKGLSYETKMINALKALPTPIEDTKHDLLLHFANNRARSNESRYEHILKGSHKLMPRDIKSIPEGIKNSKLKKDKYRKRTFEYILKRNGNKKEYIRICIVLDKNDSHVAFVKTMFISKNDK